MAHNKKNKSLLPPHDQWPERIATLKDEMTTMPIDEMYRVLLELEDKHPETFASLQKACHSLVSQNEDPNLRQFIKSVRETLTQKEGTKSNKSAASTACAGDSEKAGVPDDNNNDQLKETKKKDPFVLLRFLFESPREYRKCANDDDNMFSNYVDRVVYAMIPNSRNGKCGDCRFQRLTEAKSIRQLLTMVRKLKVTGRFCDEIVTSLLDTISNSAKCKKDALRAESLFKESRDLLLKNNHTDALSRIQKSLLMSKPETQSYKYMLRSIILNDLSQLSDSAIDWSTAMQYGFQWNLFCDLIGHSEVIVAKLDHVIALSSSSRKLFTSKSDIIGQYHNFPRPVQSGHLLPEATDRVEVVEQVSSDGIRKGYRVRAIRSINLGEVILSERSFGSVLTRDSITKRCFNCLIATKRFVPCSHCQLVRYCTETCRSQDWDNSHEQLCPLLDLLKFFPAGQAVIKILIQNGIESVVLKSRKKSDLLQKPLSNDLESFFAYRVTLSCSPWTRLNFSLTAILLTKMAFRFLDPGQVTESKLCAVILKMLMIMHETREALIEDVGKVRKRYGTFVSPVYRMLPICCQPNTLTQQLGDRTALIAAKRIEIGEEIRIH
jgi:hypothetical protein